MLGFEQLVNQLQRTGHRRLVVLSGDEPWTLSQAIILRNTLPGDWLWLEENPSKAISGLLGREYLHAVFDARRGFDVSAFAALSGTLRAGSLLVLLVPPFSVWANRPDADSLRWSDSAEPIATPHFVHHFCRTLAADADAIVWHQHRPLSLPVTPNLPAWQPASGEPQRQQAEILDALLTMPAGVAAVTAPRGRGKSALAGMLLNGIQGSAVVTAPAKGATDVIARFAGEQFHYMAPDALLASTTEADWLIVDEAAAIPGPLLEKLASRFPRVLLTTTVQGYEGTGRGFLLKFCAHFSGLRRYTLSTPIRWAAGCPLERIVANALLFDDALLDHKPEGEVRLTSLAPEMWESDPARVASVYELLCAAHYRTSPLDLRRMMDAPGQHFAVAHAGVDITGALWLVEEGGLTPQLSRAVWAGFRRPRGNLVAQSLAAHGGSPLAATLKGRRVSRIAVHPHRQREGIGQRLIRSASGEDYLSVSFGYTHELWRFWQQCGFVLVRMGSHREASSGCYTAMALLPLSEAGRQLCEQAHQRLCRDMRVLSAWNGEKIPVTDAWEATLNSDDWLELAGFAFAHRAFSTSVAALTRLLSAVDMPLPTLRGKMEGNTHDFGQKALLAKLREETAHALERLDYPRSRQLKADILQWQFFQ
ncbi:GNAT family N-acetyltransferase [Enterobacter hormaechei]|uniref:tRNA(Met) cytidine acetyltransferase TmcA n=1 Tax=Enterobacter hormaechei TaxID=158836 RepID=A0AAX3YYV2_9ENTR|nr:MULTISPECIES: GNAT family N-acetyltransferase [Enterobacter cloacae complex]UAS93368.1 GNAT family N-acetyltransferase [Enterobacter cloacae complex sp.]AJB71855.1 methionine tRNA cytidine acetyltransferase [Enterobacter hormaechei subsp. hormaechei]EGK58816.1 acetyltransferase [Enterobacter hormaechei ATCC 49162]EGQ5307893.1 tRNA(Met) cytidine acetyltransferase [Enterobacter hormaechei]EGQ5313852.1 tRNA(Met) cytidine acetyltransferase [Enterobacter hormaechei]